MKEVRVHNYAFRKALAYVRNKRGKNASESCKSVFENTIQQKLSTRSPYLPSYYPMKSFIIFLQIINNTLGEGKVQNAKKINRYHNIGFYLYTGGEVGDSPYHYLDPHKQLFQVVEDFYNNLLTASGIFLDTDITINKKNSKVEIIWNDIHDYPELFFYLEGLHEGMIKASSSNGLMKSKKQKGAFVFELEILE
jgi:hypothetical protein